MLAIKKQSFLLKVKERAKLLASLTLAALLALSFALQNQVSATEGPWPNTPPAQVCGNTTILGAGPAVKPEGAVNVPAGNNETVDFRLANTTYWFEPGVHTLAADPYGQIIPGDNATFVGAPGAILDGQHINRFAFTQQAQNVTVKYLEVRNFGTGAGNNDEGVVNHDAGANWTVEYNYVHDNDGAGVFLGTNSVVRYNCLKDNGQYGFSSYHPDGVTNVTLDHNEITGNNQDDWETLRDGCGCTGGGKFWDTRGGVVTNNWVHNNRGPGLWADHNNANFLFENNYIEENDGIGLFYEVSYNFMIKNNAFVRNALVDGKPRANAGDPFPSAAIYISESGGDTRAGSQYAQSEITGNLFEDNWDGIALWENADRFCRLNEAFDTTNGCPFFDQTWGTRYKTQNITIHANTFNVDRQAIDCTNDRCGRNAVFSNFGTHPANSPYLGTVIQEAVTHQQNNIWHDNTYNGNWRFMPHDMDKNLNFATWQAAPYNQDANSSYSSDPGAPGAPPSTPPPVAVPNDLDTDTATFEGSVGQWQAWYSATLARSNEGAHTGSNSLRVNVTDPWGWGAQLGNWPGVQAAHGAKTLSFWGKLGSGTNLQPKMKVKWLDSNYAVLQTDEVTLPVLTTNWQNISALVEAPAGTSTALVYLLGSGNAGDVIYLDDLVVGDAANAVSANSATFENQAVGEWQSWYSAGATASTQAAYRGTGSMQVTVTDPWGWAIQTGNWPGFAINGGEKRISYWVKQASGAISNVTLRAKWFDANQNLLQSDTITAQSLSANWQQASAVITPPQGATTVYLDTYSESGNVGDSIYIDDVVIANTH
ncbi:MAG TPA: right-handed parallel beta-helix repeat-containing protein [Candidatus Saccharimonadales bacterium]